MSPGKTLFVQLMDFLPWITIAHIVDRYGINHYVNSLTCAKQFRVMAFASAQSALHYYTGLRQPVRHSILADANKRCDWCADAEFA